VVINLIGKSIKIFEELDSTNNFVKMNVSNLDNGTIIVAKKQTDGRGQRSNKWLSKEGNLYFSIVLKEGINRDSIFKNIIRSTIAIVRTLDSFGIDASIKYPNDCLVGKKKISGVLIESQGSSKLEYIIIGIGINVNQLNFDDLNNKATSMKLCLKRNFNVIDVLNVFIENCDSIFDSNSELLFKEYISKSVVIDKSIIYKEEEFKIINIEYDGTLIIKNKLSEQRVAYSEISLKEFY
jgi:BirA family biotin operon repressor/biotin-[acetyl-CoA-carboxylase] ligase